MGFMDWAPQVLDVGQQLANTGLQFGQLAYQKEVQQKTWDREDNAVQRRVADMEKAGINPVLAAGGAAQASSPIAVSTPQFEVGVSDAVSRARALMRQKQDITIANQTSAIMREQYRKEKALADEAYFSMPINVDARQTALERTELDREERQYNFDIAKRDGVRSDQNGGQLQDVLQLKRYLQSAAEKIRAAGGAAGSASFGSIMKLLESL